MFQVSLSDPRGRACRAPADTDVPCSNIPAGLTRPYQNRRPGAKGPPGAWPAPRIRFPEDSRTSAPTPFGAMRGTTSTVGLASGPPGGRRAASTLDRATPTVCHSGRGPGQSSGREYPGSDVGQTREPPVRAKAWASAAPEPSEWAADVTDSAFGTGRVGLRALANRGCTSLPMKLLVSRFQLDAGTWAEPATVTHGDWVRVLPERGGEHRRRLVRLHRAGRPGLRGHVPPRCSRRPAPDRRRADRFWARRDTATWTRRACATRVPTSTSTWTPVGPFPTAPTPAVEQAGGQPRLLGLHTDGVRPSHGCRWPRVRTPPAPGHPGGPTTWPTMPRGCASPAPTG